MQRNAGWIMALSVSYDTYQFRVVKLTY